MVMRPNAGCWTCHELKTRHCRKLQLSDRQQQISDSGDCGCSKFQFCLRIVAKWGFFKCTNFALLDEKGQTRRRFSENLPRTQKIEVGRKGCCNDATAVETVNEWMFDGVTDGGDGWLQDLAWSAVALVDDCTDKVDCRSDDEYGKPATVRLCH